MRTERHGARDSLSLTDSGAQYVTRLPMSSQLHDDVYAQLHAAQLLKPLVGTVEGKRAADGGGDNLVCERGLGTLVAYLLESAGVEAICGRRACAIHVVKSSDGGRPRWRVEHEHGADVFDAVVLTQPVPQQLRLLSGCGPGAWLAESEMYAKLRAVEYSARYAMSLFFSERHRQELDALVPYVAKYVSREEDNRLVFVSYDSAKRQTRGAPSLLVHSSVPFGLARMRAKVPTATVEAELLESLWRVLPGLPQPLSVLVHPWEYSQVRYPLEMDNGATSFLLQPALTQGAVPPLVLCGDAFSPLGSRFDGCIQSGDHAATTVIEALHASGQLV